MTPPHRCVRGFIEEMLEAELRDARSRDGSIVVVASPQAQERRRFPPGSLSRTTNHVRETRTAR